MRLNKELVKQVKKEIKQLERQKKKLLRVLNTLDNITGVVRRSRKTDKQAQAEMPAKRTKRALPGPKLAKSTKDTPNANKAIPDPISGVV